ncbi:hypothetical protein VTN02DRAFT_6510 [Thermoascus thermophilus]
MSPSTKSPFCNVIIIGAGFSGLAMACQLKRKLNYDDYIIYDRCAEPGGTWWANRYPGCGVDIPAAFYSLSFAPNPDFSKFFPKQAEILQYFNDVARKFDVSRHVVCNTEWQGAYWQDHSKTWMVKLRNLSTGEPFVQECKVLISAVGGLVNPNPFHISGIDTFEGEIIHTARWKSDISLYQKDVVVIGNGSSAAQLVPAIVDQVKSLTQFIRTPQYYLPSENREMHVLWRLIFRYVPGVLLILRILVFLILESTGGKFALTRDAAAARRESTERSKNYIMKFAPERYWPLLMPSYELGCKRRVFDNDNYISCLQRDHVHLTDDPIVALQPRSVLTKSGKQYPADVILLATGFSLTQYDVDLRGRNGYTRENHWKSIGCKEAYKSVAMGGFPNFFYVLGPNSGRGHTSTIYSIENHVDLIIQVIKPVLKGRASSVEVQTSSERLYNMQLHAAIDRTVFTNTCRTYFIDKETGKNWFIYPWDSFTMWYQTHWDGMGDWTYEYDEGKDTHWQHWLSSVSNFFMFAIGLIIFAFNGSVNMAIKPKGSSASTDIKARSTVSG